MDSHNLCYTDAINYLKAVKHTLDEEKYSEFLQALGELDVNVIEQLLDGHTDLIIGFNVFLPKDKKIDLPLPEDHNNKLEEAISFLDNFENKKPQYDQILNLLYYYKTEMISVQQVHQQMALILQHDDPQLMEQFRRFLPLEAFQVIQNPVVVQHNPCRSHQRNKEKKKEKLVDEESNENNVQEDELAVDRTRQRKRKREEDHNLNSKKINCYETRSCLSIIDDNSNGSKSMTDACKTSSQLKRSLDDDVLNSLVHILEENRDKVKSIEDIHQNIVSLLHNDPGMLKTVESFLPCDYASIPRHNSSYAYVPRENVRGYNEIGASVLNNTHILIKQEFNYKDPEWRKDSYRRLLFEVEDSRYELEMKIEKLRVTLKKMKGLSKTITCKGDESIHKQLLIDCVDSTSFKYITDFFDESKKEIIVEMKVTRALPIVLSRLEKEEEHLIRHKEKKEHEWKLECQKAEKRKNN